LSDLTCFKHMAICRAISHTPYIRSKSHHIHGRSHLLHVRIITQHYDHRQLPKSNNTWHTPQRPSVYHMRSQRPHSHNHSHQSFIKVYIQFIINHPIAHRTSHIKCHNSNTCTYHRLISHTHNHTILIHTPDLKTILFIYENTIGDLIINSP
jgi:hypothetical protein